MPIVCVGLNHETAPVELRERVAVLENDRPAILREIADLPPVREAALLSTCNRVEAYVAVDEPTHGTRVLLQHFLDKHSLEKDAEQHFYTRHEEDVLRHLFRITAGLDSMVLGETQILGQVKQAYAEAHAHGATGKVLNRLFQKSFSVGKRVRCHSSIQKGTTSVGSVAVDLAGRIFGDLAQCKVMIIGAGEMSRTTAQSLLSRGARSIIVSNRSYDRAVDLADQMGGEAIRFDVWPERVTDVDIVIASTSAPHFVITRKHVEAAHQHRRGRPLFLIDIAVPRNIEPEVNDLDDMYLYDIDALQSLADEARKRRKEQVSMCLQIIDEEVAREMKLNRLGLHQDLRPFPPPTRDA